TCSRARGQRPLCHTWLRGCCCSTLRTCIDVRTRALCHGSTVWSESTEYRHARIAVHRRGRHVDLRVELGAPGDHAVSRRLEDAVEHAEHAGGLEHAIGDQQDLGGGLVVTARE